jgi:hypothetical protein
MIFFRPKKLPAFSSHPRRCGESRSGRKSLPRFRRWRAVSPPDQTAIQPNRDGCHSDQSATIQITREAGFGTLTVRLRRRAEPEQENEMSAHVRCYA